MDGVYISGPISGVDSIPYEEKLDRFHRAEKYLKDLGHKTIVNPLSVQACVDNKCKGQQTEKGFLHDWACYLRYDLIAMIERCNVIALLPHWWESRGATLECHVAKSLGFRSFLIEEEYLNA